MKLKANLSAQERSKLLKKMQAWEERIDPLNDSALHQAESELTEELRSLARAQTPAKAINIRISHGLWALAALVLLCVIPWQPPQPPIAETGMRSKGASINEAIEPLCHLKIAAFEGRFYLLTQCQTPVHIKLQQARIQLHAQPSRGYTYALDASGLPFYWQSRPEGEWLHIEADLNQSAGETDHALSKAQKAVPIGDLIIEDRSSKKP